MYWAGRHGPLPAASRRLLELLGRLGYTSVKISFVRHVETAEDFYANYISPLLDQYDRIIVVPTLPLTVVMRLAERAEECGCFEVWWPEYRTVAERVPEHVASQIAAANPQQRFKICYRDGCKVKEFVDYRRLRRVKLELEPIVEG